MEHKKRSNRLTLDEAMVVINELRTKLIKANMENDKLKDLLIAKRRKEEKGKK